MGVESEEWVKRTGPDSAAEIFYTNRLLVGTNSCRKPEAGIGSVRPGGPAGKVEMAGTRCQARNGAVAKHPK